MFWEGNHKYIPTFYCQPNFLLFFIYFPIDWHHFYYFFINSLLHNFADNPKYVVARWDLVLLATKIEIQWEIVQ